MAAEVTAMVTAPTGPGLAKAGFSQEQRDLILRTCCGDATEAEARVLLGIAEARGLNPILQECYFVKRWSNERRREEWAVQAAIDSFRIKAEETGDYAGQDEPQYEYDERGKLELARVRVYRKSVPGRPFAVGVAYWREYVQLKKDGTPTKFWTQMPHNQLAKCAEALALRKAFPKVLARVYTAEEMSQADSGDSAPALPPAPPTPKPNMPRRPMSAEEVEWNHPRQTSPPLGMSDGEAREADRVRNDPDALAKDFERQIGAVASRGGNEYELRQVGIAIGKSKLDESRRAHLQNVYATALDVIRAREASRDREPGEDDV